MVPLKEVCGMDTALPRKPIIGRRKSVSTPLNKAARIEPITVEEMDKTEKKILAHVQKESFKEEIAILHNTSAEVGN